MLAQGASATFVSLLIVSTATAAEPKDEPRAPEAAPAQSASLRRLEEPTLRVWPVVIETATLFTVMRTSEAYLWPEPFSFRQADQWSARYERAFTRPPEFDSSRGFMQWDGDRFTINVIGHGLLGSELYLRPRRCGFGLWGSLGVATAASALWEYGFEANGVQPSGVDLWYTPLSGLILGEARYQAWRASARVDHPAIRFLLRTLFDPVGEFSGAAFGSPC